MRPPIASLFALLFCSIVSACATAPVVTPATAPRIVVEPDERPGFWRATYELADPVRELRFERTPFRTGVFEVLTAGFAIEREGDTEVLRTAGAPASRIAVRFPEYTRELEKEYDFFQKFTDGSVAIYTGHLAVRHGHDAADPACPDCTLRRFRFVPPVGRHVVAGGAVVKGTADWSDSDGEGAYIYIGSITPIETGEVVAIVDPGLPSWLWDETKAALPRLFGTYATRFGSSLSERPLVLFNYADSGGSGYSSGGGVLPGQIQLRVDGAAWKERSENAFLHLFRFLAHEAAHLWNGRLVRYDGTEDAWMHEGSADALTDRVVRALGYGGEQGFLDRQSEALNECRRKLAAFPLRDAAKRNEFQLYYSCGNALALFTENAVASRDLFDFWKTLIARVRAAGRTQYDTTDYFAAMAAAGASPDDVERLRQFVAQEATADGLAEMLRAKGVPLAEAPPSEAWGQSIVREALFALLAEHCTGPYGFRAAGSGFSLTNSSSCGPLSGGGIVTAIGGHGVQHDGAAAWREMHERCATALPVRIEIRVDGTVKTVEVPCGKAVGAPIPYLKIGPR